jgi:hypothetical protein
MITILLILISAAIGGVVTHFYWAAFHKAEIDAKDVLLDEAKQAKTWAEHELATLKAQISKPWAPKPLPTPPAIPDPKLPQ